MGYQQPKNTGSLYAKIVFIFYAGKIGEKKPAD